MTESCRCKLLHASLSFADEARIAVKRVNSSATQARRLAPAAATMGQVMRLRMMQAVSPVHMRCGVPSADLTRIIRRP